MEHQDFSPHGEPFEAPEALLITGEALRAMTPERLDTISKMLGGLGLQVTTVTDLESLRSPEEEPEPLPMGKADFLKFAEDTGQTSRLATMAWNMVEATQELGDRHRNGYEEFETLPRLSFSRDEEGNHFVDLRSAHARLLASNYSWSAWISPGEAKIQFLTGMAEQVITEHESQENS